MGFLELLGGVKKSLYEEALERCRNLEGKVESQEKELSQLSEENAELRERIRSLE